MINPAFLLIDILSKIKEKLKDDSDMLWTSYETAKELRDELDLCIEQLEKGDKSCLGNLDLHFLPASTFQEHSLQNDWTKEYKKLAEKFDSIYTKMKKNTN